ncbi:MAG: hypothetical protein LBM71_03105 [Elusimicrobiota bacterium]|jgi:hypothetical protein|nr:hypothetical protein [Elusimicrobiota bacterium]
MDALVGIKSVGESAERYRLATGQYPTANTQLDITVPKSKYVRYSLGTELPNNYYYIVSIPLSGTVNYRFIYFLYHRTYLAYNKKIICQSSTDFGKKICNAIGKDPHPYSGTGNETTYVN